MDIINLTPHSIDVYGEHTVEDGAQRSFPASGMVARVVTMELGTQRIGGFNTSPIVYEMVEYGRLEGVPNLPQPGVLYIVSLVAALAARGRDDLLAPYKEVRNAAGQMIGCRYLQKVC